MRRVCAVGLSLVFVLSCSSEPIPEGYIWITTGYETGVWSADPPATTVEVVRELTDGTRLPHATLAVPASEDEALGFGIGRGAAARFELVGRDASGSPVVRGRSWYLEPATLEGYLLPMYVSRVGMFSRPPSHLPVGQGDWPPVDRFGGRFVVSAGTVENNYIRLDGYDLGWWDAALSAWIPCISDPCQVRSLAVANYTIAVMVGDSWAGWTDLDSVRAYHQPLALPKGLANFGDVAGGATIHASDDSAYIVGATRLEGPTASILRLGSDGAVSALNLIQARAGAAATWVEGRGLLVVGGSAEGPGAELLPEDEGAFVALAFASDPTVGAALVTLDHDTVLRAGGVDQQGQPAPTVRLTLTCNDECQPEPVAEPIELERVTGFLLEDGDTFWVGTDQDGYTAGRRLSALDSGIRAVSLREPRAGGSVVALSTGQIAVLGGHYPDGTPALTLELYQP